MKTKLTSEKYKCVDCGKLSQLVMIRGQACRCLSCYADYLVKRKVIRELNRMVVKN